MSQDEGDSLGGRLGRYAKVGASVGGLAAKLAGQRYLGLTLDREKHASELKAALGGLKGPLMKAAQLIATIPDALPPEYARELAQLQANAPAMGWAFVRRRMATELGPDWQARFAKFDKEASFAASLGQVHRATLLAGTEVACKLQYPDMASAMQADLNQLKLVFAVGQRFDPALRARLDRALPRLDDGRPGSRRGGLRRLGVHRPQPRDGGDSQSLGCLPLWSADGRPAAPPDRRHRRRPWPGDGPERVRRVAPS